MFLLAFIALLQIATVSLGRALDLHSVFHSWVAGSRAETQAKASSHAQMALVVL